MLTCTDQAMLSVDPRATHADHDARTSQSDFAMAMHTVAEAMTDNQVQDRALAARVRIACRDAMIKRLKVVRECLAAGRVDTAYLLTADHLVKATIRDLGGAL